VAADQQINFNQRLFDRIAAVHADRATALDPVQARLVDKYYEAWSGAAPSSTPTARPSSAPSTRSWPALYTGFGNKVLADEDTWTVLDKKAELAGLPADLVASYAAAADRAQAAGQVGGGQHPLERRSVPGGVAARDLRAEGVDRVQGPRRSRRRQRHQGHDRADRQAAGRAGALLGYATHAHLRMADTMAKDPAAAMALMMRVWPAAVKRVKEEVAAMAPFAKKDKLKGRSSRGTTSTTRRR
jgi:peptidyl-dipeptidase Dcp